MSLPCLAPGARRGRRMPRALPPALLLALLLPLAQAQTASLDVTPTATYLGMTVTANTTYSGTYDFAPLLDWGDGSPTVTLPHYPPFDASNGHAYAAAGDYDVRVLEQATASPVTYTTEASRTVTVYDTPGLTVDPATASPGSPVTAQLTGVHGTVTVDWGDGATTAGASDGSYTHRYASEGGYLVRLSAGGTTVPYASASVTVSNAPVTMQLDPNPAQVGGTVTADIAGLAGSAALDWGDGRSSAVTAGGSYEHTYQRPGAFVVSLQDGAGNPISQQLVTVSAGGTLSLDPANPVMGQTVTANADDLVAGYAYRVDWGDGDQADANAGTDGSLSVTHVYAAPQVATVVQLLLTERGTPTLLATEPLAVDLPTPGEQVQVSRTGVDAAAGAILMQVSLSGLLPGVHYLLHYGDDDTTRDLVAVAPTATITKEVTTEGTFTLQLDALFGTLPEPRASASYTATWPRGNEAMQRVDAQGGADASPVIAGDLLHFRLTGLESGVGYRLVFSGDSQNAVPVSGSGPQAAVATFAPDTPGAVTIRLMAAYPGSGGQEARASLPLHIYRPSGSIHFTETETAFGQPAEVDLGDLIPGAGYTLHFGDGQTASLTAPETGIAVLHHAYTTKQSDARLYLEHHGASELVDNAPLPATTFANTITPGFASFFQNGRPTYDVAFTVDALAPGYSYVLDFGDGAKQPLTADADGTATVHHTFSQGFDGGQSYHVQLRLALSGGELTPTSIHLTGSNVPPLHLDFAGGFTLRVTGVQDFAFPNGNDDVSGTGVLENLVVGGRQQDPVAFAFQHLRLPYNGSHGDTERSVFQGNAELSATKLALHMPLRLQGLSLTLTGFALKPVTGASDFMPTVAGEGALPTGTTFTFDRVLDRGFRPQDGFMLSVNAPTGEVPVGSTDWAFGGLYSQDVSTVIDLSTASNYNIRNAGAGQTLEQQAYAGWQRAGRTPSVDPGEPAWTGILYWNTFLHLRTGGNSNVRSVVSMTAPAKASLVWTSSGYQGVYANDFHAANGGPFTWGGWSFDILQDTRIDFVDSTIASTRPAVGSVHLPMFDEDVPVAITPLYRNDRFGRPAYRFTTAGPVAHDFGHGGILAGQGSFEFVPGTNQGDLQIVFPNAVWAIDASFASDPTKLDTGSADRVMASLPGDQQLAGQARQAYSDAKATAETVINAYKLEFLMNDLTFTAAGGVSLGGQEWRTLLKVPALQIAAFPYLAAGAEIGVRRSGGDYQIGLKGNLSVDDYVKAQVAPSWFVFNQGQLVGWRFEGVSFGYDGGEASPVSFTADVGGSVDFRTGDLSLTGAGSLTVEKKFNVGVGAAFGQKGGTPYWLVYASTDLAKAGTPIIVRVEGVPVLAFYQFEGGVGSHLKLTTYGQGNQDCRADDGAIDQLKVPSVLANVDQCVDTGDPFNLLAGTVIGYIDQGKDSATYGLLWHLKGDLVLNASKNLVIAGRGWTMKTLDDGVYADAAPGIAGNLTIDAGGITASFCAGPQGRSIGGLDCSGLVPFRIEAAGVKLVEVNGVAGLIASWSSNQHYLAVGTHDAPLSIYVIPSYKSGYLVAGTVPRAGIVDPNVPIGSSGVFVNGQFGWSWSWDKSGSIVVCHWHAWAHASFGFGGGLALYLRPDGNTQMRGSVDAWGNANAGGSCGKVNLSVGASIYARGTITAPNPLQFDGDMTVSAHISYVDKDIDVTTHATVAIPD